MEKTFGGRAGEGQGPFVIHYHGSARLPFGHPHAHAVLSPGLQGWAALQYIPRSCLARIKERWANPWYRSSIQAGDEMKAPSTNDLVGCPPRLLIQHDQVVEPIHGEGAHKSAKDTPCSSRRAGG